MALKKYLINPIKELADQGKLAGILLIAVTAFSMLLSNSQYGESYVKLWDTEIGFPFLHKSLLHWINDGFMVVFFLMVGLEIKREIVHGELSSPKQAVLPIMAALGGMIVPAILFVAINARSPENMSGWAIPMATDIAFSLGILSILGRRVPLTLKIFLTALAIIDDLGAIIIIAAFYTHQLKLDFLLYGIGVFLLMILMNRQGVKYIMLYMIPGIIMWYFILKSGVHPTIAGVLTAFAIPVDSGEELEHRLTKPVNFIILPLFALANTAIILTFDMGSGFLGPLSIGIIAGLFVGKPIGIFVFSYLAKIYKWASFPEGMGMREIIGLGFTAGIGFTMSIFITSLSFDSAVLLTQSKLAIILGSVFSAVAGLLILGANRKESRVR
jgi:NhaA family Na+:H+ antiporter